MNYFRVWVLGVMGLWVVNANAGDGVADRAYQVQVMTRIARPVLAALSENKTTPEGQLRGKFGDMARQCVINITDPASPDFGNFNKGDQPLVDAAFHHLAYMTLIRRGPRNAFGQEKMFQAIMPLQESNLT